ncbi:MAG TPA: hypothetical protein VGK73_38560, partial [Polyangiaceae bacterium]
MPIDASIGSSQTSVTTTHRDFRAGGVQYLPQRIVILAQGATGMVYSTEKWQATGAEAGGSKYGWGCPIHSTLLELMPTDGREGVGGIPVTVLPLVDDGSGVAANGQIVPSGTATVQSSYRARIGGVLSRAFVIGTAALVTAELTKACRAIHDAIDAVLEMPVEVTYDYGTVTAAALNGTGNGTVGTFTTTVPLPVPFT